MTVATLPAQADRRLAQILESLVDGVILFDTADRVVLFNERYKALHPPIADLVELGVSFEEILRQAALRGGVDPGPDGIDDWVARCVVQHRAPGAPFESRLRDGSWLRIEERITADGEILCIHTGITREKRLAAALDMALESVEHGLAILDADRRLIASNSRFGDLLGALGYSWQPQTDKSGPQNDSLDLLRLCAGTEAGADEMSRALGLSGPSEAPRPVTLSIGSQALHLACAPAKDGFALTLKPAAQP